MSMFVTAVVKLTFSSSTVMQESEKRSAIGATCDRRFDAQRKRSICSGTYPVRPELAKALQPRFSTQAPDSRPRAEPALREVRSTCGRSASRRRQRAIAGGRPRAGCRGRGRRETRAGVSCGYRRRARNDSPRPTARNRARRARMRDGVDDHDGADLPPRGCVTDRQLLVDIETHALVDAPRSGRRQRQPSCAASARARRLRSASALADNSTRGAAAQLLPVASIAAVSGSGFHHALSAAIGCIVGDGCLSARRCARRRTRSGSAPRSRPF
jgi:hypothetical protein